MNPFDSGARFGVKVGVSPQNTDGTVINGAAIDRTGFMSCILAAAVGAVTGTPTSFTVPAKIQDSADGSTGWNDVTDGAITTLTAINTAGKKSVNLATAKKYIRVVVDVAFVSGTTPTADVAALVLLGGGDTDPQA